LAILLVAPALRGGRGLKQLMTSAKGSGLSAGGSRPSGRERIETFFTAPYVDNCRVAPALRGGRGLKRDRVVYTLIGCLAVAPALRGGRGLKQNRNAAAGYYCAYVAPALRGGRGLKPECPASRPPCQNVAPALRGGRGLKQQDLCEIG